MLILTGGIDPAKNALAVHGVDLADRAKLVRSLLRPRSTQRGAPRNRGPRCTATVLACGSA